MDTFSKEERSAIMRRVHSRNTGPELEVRHLVHSLGFRYRLHRRDLPGCPDIVFPGRRKIILVHGCFWHGHCCGQFSVPKSNVRYWRSKLTGNVNRDRANRRELRALSWDVLVIWECQTKNGERLSDRIFRFLEDPLVITKRARTAEKP